MDYVSASNLRRCYDSAMALFRSTDDFTSACDSDADDKDNEMLKVASARRRVDWCTLVGLTFMIRGTCTDRGTEFGIVDAEGGNAVSYAAPWIQGSRALYADGCVPVQQKQKLLMPNAVASAGICYCFDNLEADMDRQLSLWTR